MKDVKLLMAVVLTFSMLTSFALTPEIRNIVAKQRFPWNGLVDINCEVAGIAGATKYEFDVHAILPDSGRTNRVSHYWVVQSGTNLTNFVIRTNGNYQIVWDAKLDLGVVRYTNMVVRVTANEFHRKVQLWEGGPYWAETNIGAEESWEYGYYFRWGDTIGYKRKNDAWVASDGSSSNFSFTYGGGRMYHKSRSSLRSAGWITSDNVLAPEYDAAHAQWGGYWRMPTDQELCDLNSKCNWTWTEMNGVRGYVVSGKGNYSSASIFLPCAGLGVETSLSNADSSGYFWSSVPDVNNPNYSRYIYLSSNLHDEFGDDRSKGRSVRPVQGFTE